MKLLQRFIVRILRSRRNPTWTPVAPRLAAARTHQVEVREGRVIHIVPRDFFQCLVADRFFRDDAIWRGYWEERFRRVYPKRKSPNDERDA